VGRGDLVMIDEDFSWSSLMVADNGFRTHEHAACVLFSINGIGSLYVYVCALLRLRLRFMDY
jgi:hypothetical protein